MFYLRISWSSVGLRIGILTGDIEDDVKLGLKVGASTDMVCWISMVARFFHLASLLMMSCTTTAYVYDLERNFTEKVSLMLWATKRKNSVSFLGLCPRVCANCCEQTLTKFLIPVRAEDSRLIFW